MLSVVNFFRGYLEVEIVGPYPERFINICSQNGITFWNLNREDRDRLTARVRVLEIARLRELAQNALCEVRVLSQRGAPFFVWKFRKRYLFIAGFLFFALVLYFSSLRIWDIKVYGNHKVSEERILKNLREIGVGIGTSSSKIDPEFIENSMLLRIPELSWLTVNVRGSKAEVEVRERSDPPKIVDKKIPCNVVARRGGIITKLVVLDGSTQVEVGDTVTEGQLIASGVMDTVVGMRLVHAMAQVEARTWYTITAKIPAKINIKEYTEEKILKTAVIIAGHRLNLYFNSSIPYERCDKIVKKTQLSLPGGYVLPITWVTENYLEYNTHQGQLDAEVAAYILRQGLKSRLEEMVPEGEILRTDYTLALDGSFYTMTLTAECLEDIAKTVEIPINIRTGG
ncbi:MAG: sporulation protein YqfD [Eubacteriales bacterium]|jgi:similar to stage IV sporulation protein